MDSTPNIKTLFVLDESADLREADIPFFNPKTQSAAFLGFFSNSPNRIAQDLVSTIENQSSGFENLITEVHFLLSEYAFLPPILEKFENVFRATQLKAGSCIKTVKVWAYKHHGREVSGFHLLRQFEQEAKL